MKKVETSSHGTDGHLNVFTGEYQQPVIIDYSKGEKNIHTLGASEDTTTFRQHTNIEKSNLAELLPENILSSHLTDEDIQNSTLIYKIREEEYIPTMELKWLPLKAIKKLLDIYNIKNENTM